MAHIIAPGGSLEVTLSAGQAVCVATRGKAVLASKAPASEGKVLESANPEPGILVDNEEYVSSAYAAGGVVLVQNMGPFLCYVEQGTAPLSKDFRRETEIRGGSIALNSTGTITTAMLLSGSITSTDQTVTATLETGAVMDAGSSWEIGEGVNWGVIKTGANTFTVTAAASGHTLVGSGAVATTTAAMFRTVKTAADTFVTTRIG
jgi:hypothetical protein